MAKNDSHYLGALLEEMNHRLQLVQEAVEPLKSVPDDIRQIKECLDGMDDWRDVAKLVIKDHSKSLNNHETRLTTLETA